jgi:hypothetical protein
MTRSNRPRDGIQRRQLNVWVSIALVDEVAAIATRRGVPVAAIVEDCVAFGIANYKVSEALADGGRQWVLDTAVTRS